MNNHSHNDVCEALRRDVDSFLSETGMGEVYFGKRACGNSRLVERLRDGRRVWPETIDRVRSFMDERLSGGLE